MSLLETLVADRVLTWPDSQAPLGVSNGHIQAPSGRLLGPLEGPLDFLPRGDSPVDLAQIPAGDVAGVRDHLQLPDTPAVDVGIRMALRTLVDGVGADHLSAEARMLAERFRIPQFEFLQPRETREPLKGGLLARIRRGIGVTQANAAVEWLGDGLGERMTAGHEVFRSIRVRNVGGVELPAGDGAGGTRITSWWEDGRGASLAGATASIALPVSVAPGREITLQVSIRPPKQAGRHVLCAALATPGRAQPLEFLRRELEVTLCELPVFDYAYHAAALDYESDHRVAVDELSAFLAGRPEKPTELFLEIGGGVHPTGQAFAWKPGRRVVSCDVSLAQCMLGQLYFRHHHPNLDSSLAFMSCDAQRLPFADGVLDGVMFFAAFHHFAEPLAMLREARRATRPDGFVFIGCDNCVPDPDDPLYREELARGINEQVWTLAEYTDLFKAAGMEVARARIDNHSIKVVLVKS